MTFSSLRPVRRGYPPAATSRTKQPQNVISQAGTQPYAPSSAVIPPADPQHRRAKLPQHDIPQAGTKTYAPPAQLCLPPAATPLQKAPAACHLLSRHGSLRPVRCQLCLSPAATSPRKASLKRARTLTPPPAQLCLPPAATSPHQDTRSTTYHQRARGLTPLRRSYASRRPTTSPPAATSSHKTTAARHPRRAHRLTTRPTRLCAISPNLTAQNTHSTSSSAGTQTYTSSNTIMRPASRNIAAQGIRSTPSPSGHTDLRLIRRTYASHQQAHRLTPPPTQLCIPPAAASPCKALAARHPSSGHTHLLLLQCTYASLRPQHHRASFLQHVIPQTGTQAYSSLQRSYASRRLQHRHASFPQHLIPQAGAQTYASSDAVMHPTDRPPTSPHKALAARHPQRARKLTPPPTQLCVPPAPNIAAQSLCNTISLKRARNLMSRPARLCKGAEV